MQNSIKLFFSSTNCFLASSFTSLFFETLRKLGVEERIVLLVQGMYANAQAGFVLVRVSAKSLM